MKLHKIKRAAPDDAAGNRLKMWIEFDDDPKAIVDLAETFAVGGVLGALYDGKQFAQVQVADDGRSIFWRTGPGVDDIVDLCADALWLMAHPEDRAEALAPP
jgi:Protein of unknown function (DUF2442)